MKHIPLLLIIVLLVSCNMGKSEKSQDNEKPVIAVTIEPQRYFTEAIAGDKFDVISIVPKGSSPETYDPTPQQLVSLGDSKAYLLRTSMDGSPDRQYPAHTDLRYFQRY